MGFVRGVLSDHREKLVREGALIDELLVGVVPLDDAREGSQVHVSHVSHQNEGAGGPWGGVAAPA